MTPDPLPVALPELPTVAWMYRNGRHLELVEQRNDLLFPKHGEELVRKSDALVAALTALRAQAEEVEGLRKLLCELAALKQYETPNSKRNFVTLNVPRELATHLAASKQEKTK